MFIGEVKPSLSPTRGRERASRASSWAYWPPRRAHGRRQPVPVPFVITRRARRVEIVDARAENRRSRFGRTLDAGERRAHVDADDLPLCERERTSESAQIQGPRGLGSTPGPGWTALALAIARRDSAIERDATRRAIPRRDARARSGAPPFAARPLARARVSRIPKIAQRICGLP